MRAVLLGESPPTFPEAPEEHVARVHPDPIETKRERAELERQLADRLGRR